MKLLFIHTMAPHGRINAQESLDALLMGSAFSECSLLLLNDGLLQLVTGQDTAGIGARNFSKTFGALADYGVTQVYCRAADLEHYHLQADDLVINVHPLDAEGIQALLAGHDRVVNF